MFSLSSRCVGVMVFCINGVSIGVRSGYALAVFCATVMDGVMYLYFGFRVVLCGVEIMCSMSGLLCNMFLPYLARSLTILVCSGSICVVSYTSLLGVWAGNFAMLRSSLRSVLYIFLAIGSCTPPNGATAYSRFGLTNVLYVWSAVLVSHPRKRPWTCRMRFCLLRILFNMWLRWDFQLRCLFMYTPRYLTSLASLRGVFQSVRCMSFVSCCFFRVKCLC